MSKLNQKRAFLALLAISPMIAWSPSQMLVKREMASIDPSSTSVVEELSSDLKIKNDGIDIGQSEIASEIAIKPVVKDESTSEAKAEKVESKEEKSPIVALEVITQKEDKKEKEQLSCENKNEIQDLEKDVEEVISENQKLIDKFTKLNEKYRKDLAQVKEKVQPKPQFEMGQDQWNFLTMGIMALLLQSNQNRGPSVGYINNPLAQMGHFSGPGWNYLPSQGNMAQMPHTTGFQSWEHSYYNIPTMGVVNPALTPTQTSLTTDLYPAIYTSNGEGRALRAPSELAPARGYTPQFLSPDATSQRINQSGIAF